MSVGRYKLSIALMMLAAVCFAILAVIDNTAWGLLALASLAWPVKGAMTMNKENR